MMANGFLLITLFMVTVLVAYILGRIDGMNACRKKFSAWVLAILKSNGINPKCGNGACPGKDSCVLYGGEICGKLFGDEA